MDIIERFAAQCSPTGTAYKTIGVVQIAHGLAGLAGPRYLFTARVTDAYKKLFQYTIAMMD